MTGLGASSIIEIWERGQDLHPIQRALLMIEAGVPDLEEEPASLPIGTRDRLLYGLRVATFGDRFDAFSKCTACGSSLEFDTSQQVAQVFTEAPETAHAREIAVGGTAVTVRAPASRDLVRALQEASPEEGRASLLAACVSSNAADVEALVAEPEIAAEIEAALLRVDPAAELLLSLSCPDCSHTWRAVFDVGIFLWNDISRAAQDLLESVHLLASTYGWSEQAILNMPAARRRFYLNRILA